jgi:hypothetical protein
MRTENGRGVLDEYDGAAAAAAASPAAAAAAASPAAAADSGIQRGGYMMSDSNEEVKSSLLRDVSPLSTALSA